MIDIKTYDIDNRDRGGEIPAGEALHDMAIRLTINAQFLVVEVEAVIDYAPFNICPSITAVLQQLKGVAIGPGWTATLRKLFKGTQGCTHLTELLSPIATTAFQTMHKSQDNEERGAAKPLPQFLNSCHALNTEGEAVRDFWPEHYQPVRKDAVDSA
jgi:hypothetical protein